MLGIDIHLRDHFGLFYTISWVWAPPMNPISFHFFEFFTITVWGKYESSGNDISIVHRVHIIFRAFILLRMWYTSYQSI